MVVYLYLFVLLHFPLQLPNVRYGDYVIEEIIVYQDKLQYV